MQSKLSRRKFLADSSVIVAGFTLLGSCSTSKGNATSVPGMDLGYSAITWQGNDVQAIKDISALGFKGIQLRSNILKGYGSKPEEIRSLLQQYKLEFPMFSSGNTNINTGNDEEVIMTHVNNARFVKACGGKNIQLTNSSRPKDGQPAVEDLKKLGKLMNEIGKRTLDIGVQANYHNHMGQLGQTPEEVETILANCDEKYVKFLLDIAHYQQGGGDPVKAIRDHKERINVLHLKDVRQNPAGSERPYTFVELGQGRVDLPAIVNTLRDIHFKGWGL
jgi:inosose dehydratase